MMIDKMELSARGEKLSAWAAEVGRRRSADSSELTFETSSSMLRDLVRQELVKMTDLRDDPEWFFEAHRIVAAHGDDLGSGFWTRFTVQFNLFAGTVLAAGGPLHVEQLRAMQAAGELGCFALTEKFAGVSSGMVVETVAAFDAASRTFVLRSPNEGAVKNWISQGFCADKSVVIADLQLGDGVSQGAHAFLIDFRVPQGGGAGGGASSQHGAAAKRLVAGVRLADMGRKTVANDLDNAWCAMAAAPQGLGAPASRAPELAARNPYHPSPPPFQPPPHPHPTRLRSRVAFDGVRVPESCLLDRYSSVDATGRRMVQRQHDAQGATQVSGMMQIGQRLFSGRVAVAQAAQHACIYTHIYTYSVAVLQLCYLVIITPCAGGAGLRPASLRQDERLHGHQAVLGAQGPAPSALDAAAAQLALRGGRPRLRVRGAVRCTVRGHSE